MNEAQKAFCKLGDVQPMKVNFGEELLCERDLQMKKMLDMLSSLAPTTIIFKEESIMTQEQLEAKVLALGAPNNCADLSQGVTSMETNMKVFDVGNSKNFGMLVCAKDSHEALMVAMVLGHIKNAFSKRVKVVGPQNCENDSAYPSLLEILNGKARGQLFKQVDAFSFADILKGKRGSNGKWLLKEVRYVEDETQKRKES